MNDTIDSCKCACHENRPPMNTDGLAHDRVCCDEMNGQLEWCEVKRLIAKAVVGARIDGLLMAKYGTKDNSFEEKFIDNLIQQLNTDKKIDMSIQSEIVDLTDKWFEYVSQDHHKGRDCHFYITLDYKYGDEPIFEIDHFGYIGDEFHAKAHTLEKAQAILLDRIKQMIAKQKEWVDDVLSKPNEYDKWQVNSANKFIELFTQPSNKSKE